MKPAHPGGLFCFYTMSPSRIRYSVGALLVFLAAFCFALKGILIKLAYAYHIDSISLLSLRMGFALPIYAGIAVYLNRRLPPAQLTRQQWAMVALTGITGYYAASYFDFLGLLYIDASLERILLFTYPTFVLLLNATLLNRLVTRLQLLALLLTYAGIFLAFAQDLQAGHQRAIYVGAAWVIGSGVVYAVYLVGSDSLIGRLGSQRYTCYAMMAATIPTLLHCYAHNGLQLSSFPTPVYVLGGIMAILVTVIPTFMMAEGIRRIGSGNTSIVASIGPVFTIGLATTILGETISGAQLAGTGLVLVGVFTISWRGSH